jgi:hypothetical protein
MAARGQEPKHLCHKGTHRTQRKNLLSLWPFVAFCGQFIPGFPRPFSLPPFPLQNVKEQAPERLTYSTLPRFDGNAMTIIQLFSAPMGFAAFLMAFSRAEGAESAEKEIGICNATCCEILAFSHVKQR